jgi:peptidoglycan/xylan/chitin deacetylase (PgdA/CDA1 family)
MVAALGVACVGPAAAGSRAVQDACFAPDALHAIEGERVPVKGDRDYDKLPSSKDELAPHPPIAAGLRGAIRRVELPKGEKLIALTFDLCEQRGEVAGYDGDIFDYLRRENVKATLFAGGKWMRSHQARTEQLMSDPLFELANHSETHRNLRLLDSAEVQNEIMLPQHTYELTRQHLAAAQCAASAVGGMEQIAPRLSMFRFPFGACSPATLAAVNDAGLLAIQWDLSTGDPDPHQSTEAIARAMVRDVHPGSIIIGHGNGRGWNTATALPIAIPKLKAMGYQFVTVSELLARGKPVIVDTCYDSHPGDTDRYDFLSGLHGKGNSVASQTRDTGAHDAGSLPWTAAPEQSKAPNDQHTPAASGKQSPSSSWPF